MLKIKIRSNAGVGRGQRITDKKTNDSCKGMQNILSVLAFVTSDSGSSEQSKSRVW